jgi:lipopolysaccharide export system protein LptA
MPRVALLSPARPILLALLVFAAVWHAPLARAEKADRDKPINFQGDSLGGNTDTKISDLVGNVVITQGTLTIHADRIQFHQNPDNSVSATATGNPVSFREKRDGTDEYYEGFAQRIVYDGAKRIVELFDRALLKRTGDELRGNYISYNAETNMYKAEGRPDSKPPAAGEPALGPRVRGVFLPQSKEGKDAKDPAKGATGATDGKDAKAATDSGKAKAATDAKDGKDGKDGKGAAPKSSDPVALKPDPSLNLGPAK